MTGAEILGMINAIGLLVLGFLQWNNQRRQVNSQVEVGDADAAESITNSATALVSQLQIELTMLRPLVPKCAQLDSEVYNLRRANERLINWTERLVEQIEAAGLKPVPFRINAESDRMKTLPVERKNKDKGEQ